MALVSATGVSATGATITVRADGPTRPVSRTLTGACLEDVNHEVYGGIYSQMLYGESFQEPAPAAPIAGFSAYGGTWTAEDGALTGGAGDGPRLVANGVTLGDGEVRAEVFLADRAAGLAELVVRAGRCGNGADSFDGYEIGLDPAAGLLRVGRHCHDYRLLEDTPCELPIGAWISLTVRLAGGTIEVLVDGKSVARIHDPSPLPAGSVGFRQWRREGRYRALRVSGAEGTRDLPLVADGGATPQVSGMWRLVRTGSAEGRCTLLEADPYAGVRSQRVEFGGGEGSYGIENRGLNRCGLHLEAGKPYEGCLMARAERETELCVALETADGFRLAERRLTVQPGGWRKLPFGLTPSARADGARFAVVLERPGTVDLGYALLEPGEWGRFRGLPVRRDVAEGLIRQGVTVLRYGGCMANASEYRWKKMIGPRESRPPYAGFWYPYSSNGWGIIDFIAFCRAAGFACVPDFHMGETPEDMADFIEYANGPATSEWGKRRVADGFPEPFGLRYLQLGNEERVNEEYADRFLALAEAIWARDPEIVLIVGDFAYARPIDDPDHVEGAAGGISNLSAQKRIMAAAKARDREVWFDVHIWTEGPGRSDDFRALPSVQEAFEAVSEGARHRIAVFEFNAGNHELRRALANAEAIHLAERLGLPMATSANCLQVDGHNDNDWSQGLLFLNPSDVWLQPPGYVCQMLSRNYQPLLLECAVEGAELDVTAKRSEDGKTLVVEVVNTSGAPVETVMRLEGFTPTRPTARVEELTGDLHDRNTADEPERIAPTVEEWSHGSANGAVVRTFAPHSLTVVRFE